MTRSIAHGLSATAELFVHERLSPRLADGRLTTVLFWSPRFVAMFAAKLRENGCTYHRQAAAPCTAVGRGA